MSKATDSVYVLFNTSTELKIEFIHISHDYIVLCFTVGFVQLASALQLFVINEKQRAVKI